MSLVQWVKLELLDPGDQLAQGVNQENQVLKVRLRFSSSGTLFTKYFPKSSAQLLYKNVAKFSLRFGKDLSCVRAHSFTY